MNNVVKYVVVIVFVVVIAIVMVKMSSGSVAAGEAVATCVDTDGGINYLVRGKVSTRTFSVVDGCLSGSSRFYIAENYCRGSNALSKIKDCRLLGFHRCANGICI